MTVAVVALLVIAVPENPVAVMILVAIGTR